MPRSSLVRAGPPPLAISSWLLRYTDDSPFHTALQLLVGICPLVPISGTFIFSVIPVPNIPLSYMDPPPENFPVLLLFYLSTRYPKHQFAPTTTFLTDTHTVVRTAATVAVTGMSTDPAVKASAPGGTDVVCARIECLRKKNIRKNALLPLKYVNSLPIMILVCLRWKST